jgi:hypothetical protein
MDIPTITAVVQLTFLIPAALFFVHAFKRAQLTWTDPLRRRMVLATISMGFLVPASAIYRVGGILITKIPVHPQVLDATGIMGLSYAFYNTMLMLVKYNRLYLTYVIGNKRLAEILIFLNGLLLLLQVACGLFGNSFLIHLKLSALLGTLKHVFFGICNYWDF